MTAGPLSRWLTGQDADREDLFQERAGILQFEAGFDRLQAEHLARLEVFGPESNRKALGLQTDEPLKIEVKSGPCESRNELTNNQINKRQGYIMPIIESCRDSRGAGACQSFIFSEVPK